jgi:Skp family chaperone for outer membrane proteins
MKKMFLKTLVVLVICSPLFGSQLVKKTDIIKKVDQKKEVVTKKIDTDIEELLKKNLNVKFVNGYQIAGSSKKGIEIKVNFLKKKEQTEKELQAEQQKLLQADREFKTKASTLSESVRIKEEKKIAKMDRDLKIKVQELKEELEAEMYKKTEELGIEFESVVKSFALESQVDIVFDESSGRPIYVAENLRCTDEIIKMMDNVFDKKGHSTDKIKA